MRSDAPSGSRLDGDLRIRAGLDASSGLPAWLATCGGVTVLVAGSLPVPVVAIPLGVVVILVSLVILYRASAFGEPGGGHGLSGLLTAALGVTLALALALVPAAVARDVLPDLPDRGQRHAQTPSTAISVAPGPSTTGHPESVTLHPAGVQASASAGPSQDAAGNAVTFGAANAIDGDQSTAWRVEGDGVGKTLTFEFGRPVHLVAIGLLPGYDKVDPVSGADRFRQNRRVSAARYAFSDGSALDVSFSDEAAVQFVDLDVETTTVEVEITASTAGAGRDFTPISEVTFTGWVAG
jgi:hypothetical protein